MSTLSQFISGSDVNRLKLKNGPYLDEISPPSSYGIRDFSAQNDHLMIVTTDYRLYVGKKFNELIPCAPLDSNIFIPGNFNPGEYDINIGGDPFPVDPSVVTTAFSYYDDSTNHIFWKSSNDIPIKSFYEDSTAVAVETVLNFTTNAVGNLRSFIYSDGGLNKRLLAVHSSNSSSLRVHFHNEAQGTWDLQTYSYSGQTNVFPAATGSFNLTFNFTPSYLTIDPSTGNAVFMMSYVNGNQYFLFKCAYNPTTAVIDITDATVGNPNISFSMREIAISSDGNTYVAAYTLGPTQTYFVSTDGGSTWTSYDMNAANGYQCKHIGYANGKFYTIAARSASTYRGVLLSTSTPQTPSSWQLEVIPGLEFPSILRDNKRGTACYISTGSFVAQNYETFTPKGERHIIKKIV